MRTALMITLAVSWIAAGAFAQTGRAPRTAPPGASAEKPPADPNGEVGDALASCLAIWDPATHMTKRQWARACRRVADRLKDTRVE